MKYKHAIDALISAGMSQRIVMRKLHANRRHMAEAEYDGHFNIADAKVKQYDAAVEILKGAK